MKKFNHYRHSFEQQFFQFLVRQTNLTEMITNLYEYEEKARQEYAESKGELNDEMNEILQGMGLCFRFFEGETTINTIRDLETDLSTQANLRNKKRVLELMRQDVSLNTDFELQIYFA